MSKPENHKDSLLFRYLSLITTLTMLWTLSGCSQREDEAPAQAPRIEYLTPLTCGLPPNPEDKPRFTTPQVYCEPSLDPVTQALSVDFKVSQETSEPGFVIAPIAGTDLLLFGGNLGTGSSIELEYWAGIDDANTFSDAEIRGLLSAATESVRTIVNEHELTLNANPGDHLLSRYRETEDGTLILLLPGGAEIPVLELMETIEARSKIGSPLPRWQFMLNLPRDLVDLFPRPTPTPTEVTKAPPLPEATTPFTTPSPEPAAGGANQDALTFIPQEVSVTPAQSIVFLGRLTDVTSLHVNSLYPDELPPSIEQYRSAVNQSLPLPSSIESAEETFEQSTKLGFFQLVSNFFRRVTGHPVIQPFVTGEMPLTSFSVSHIDFAAGQVIIWGSDQQTKQPIKFALSRRQLDSLLASPRNTFSVGDGYSLNRPIEVFLDSLLSNPQARTDGITLGSSWTTQVLSDRNLSRLESLTGATTHISASLLSPTLDSTIPLQLRTGLPVQLTDIYCGPDQCFALVEWDFSGSNRLSPEELVSLNAILASQGRPWPYSSISFLIPLDSFVPLHFSDYLK